MTLADLYVAGVARDPILEFVRKAAGAAAAWGELWGAAVEHAELAGVPMLYPVHGEKE